MKVRTIAVTLVALAGLASTAHAADWAYEVYICDFNEGKGMEDMLEARDFYLERAAAAGREPPTAYIWTPYRGNVDFDLLWFNVFDTLTAWGEEMDWDETWDDLNAVMARFNEVAKCRASISHATGITGSSETTQITPPSLIENWACNLKHGIRARDLDDLYGHLRSAVAQFDWGNEVFMFASSPISPGETSKDVYITAVHDGPGQFARRETEFLGSEAGQSVLNHINSLLDCNVAFFNGWRVVPVN